MRRRQRVFRLGQQAHSDWNRLLTAAHIDPADDLSLPVEFALDAVLHLAHHLHVVGTAAGQL